MWWELRVSQPIVNPWVLRSPTLAVASVLTFVTGVGLFTSVYLTPVFSSIGCNLSLEPEFPAQMQTQKQVCSSVDNSNMKKTELLAISLLILIKAGYYHCLRSHERRGICRFE